MKKIWLNVLYIIAGLFLIVKSLIFYFLLSDIVSFRDIYFDGDFYDMPWKFIAMLPLFLGVIYILLGVKVFKSNKIYVTSLIIFYTLNIIEMILLYAGWFFYQSPHTTGLIINCIGCNGEDHFSTLRAQIFLWLSLSPLLFLILGTIEAIKEKFQKIK